MILRAPRRPVAALLVLASLVAAGGTAAAQTGFGNDEAFDLRAAMKWSTLVARAPADTVLYPKRWSGTNLWRLRLMATLRPASSVRLEVAYEQRLEVASGDAGLLGASTFLPSESPPPYRIEPLQDELVESGTSLMYEHELDRALVSLSVGRLDVSLGRQAVGWGRGVLFSAVDIFAPFTPLQSEREWRRGVDAVRVGAPVTHAISLEGVAAFGEDVDASAFALRLYGFLGDLDTEVVAGRRFEDLFAGASVSVPLFGAELHGEAAVYRTPEPFAERANELVLKAVAGGSYSFNAGRGVCVLGEYHYSGFGAGDTDELSYWLLLDGVLERILRGDLQILGRHAAALQATYGLGAPLSWSLLVVANPVDGSGVAAPGFTWTATDHVTLSGSLYLPFGEESEDGRLMSEYGATPRTGLLTLSFYP
ncbi:MAG: hypothetical protein GF405_11175 [Candidatus Eisenbacteria bacterium]|nr:hypothetical protein [Candidatus Eisenbacteria bacterium]